MHKSYDIRPAATDADYQTAAALFRTYAAGLDIDLSYQNFAAEVAGLPGRYAPPMGEILIARDASGEPRGCIALRPLDEAGCCELKRLYVAPEARGLGLGRALVAAVIAAARRMRYREVKLDTLPSMTKAQALYRSFGFVDVPAYYATPIHAKVFMALTL